MTIQVSYSGDLNAVLSTERKQQLEQVDSLLKTKSGAGSEFLGWLDWPSTVDTALINSIEDTAKKIQDQADVLVVIGIGGSYLGSKAVMEALKKPFGDQPKTEVVFAGHYVSGEYLKQLMKYLDDKEVAVNVISKSGTTTEPALAFRFLQDYMEKRYGDAAAERIYVTTDAEKGALLQLSKEKGYTRYVVPSNIGGRYSVFTAVGLLPIAVMGHSIRDLLAGAKEAEIALNQFSFDQNPAVQYAAIRHHEYMSGHPVELMAVFEPKLSFVQEWWKQLFGESEGKGGKGIFPASVAYTTDLHSLGQYVQDGKRMLFETFLMVKEVDEDIAVFEAENNGDELNYLSGLTLQEFNWVGYEATAQAHLDGGVPIVTLTLPKLDVYHIGYLLYFYMISCVYSAYMLEINPFDQPGVEDYKTNIFKLLKKPGYEA